MSPEASPETMGDMEDLMDQHLSLIFSAEPIKPFGEDLDDIMRALYKGHLHDSWQSMTPSNHSSALRTFAPHADHPCLINVGHLQFPDDLLDSQVNIFGKNVLNHDPKNNVISSLTQRRDIISTVNFLNC